MGIVLVILRMERSGVSDVGRNPLLTKIHTFFLLNSSIYKSFQQTSLVNSFPNRTYGIAKKGCFFAIG